MNEFSHWKTFVWKYENTKLLERIKENAPANLIHGTCGRFFTVSALSYICNRSFC